MSCLLGLVACGGPATPLFPGSEFWRPLPSAPEIDPDNAAYITDLLQAHAGGLLNINVDEYNIPVVRPPADTQRTDVAISWEGETEVLAQVPIPQSAQPARGTDGHLVVVDEASKTSFELWRAVRSGARWTASGGVAFDLTGDGVNRKGNGVRASSLSLLLGLITYDELRSGRPIEHALAWAFDIPSSRFYAPPATSSDGKDQGRPGSIPQGARLQLDPALDVTTLGLSPAGVRLAQALQRYGMLCVDSSGASTLFAEALDGTGRTWEGLLAYDELHRIPVNRLRVIRMTKIAIP